MLEPVTVAVNCCVPLVSIEAETGEIVNENDTENGQYVMVARKDLH